MTREAKRMKINLQNLCSLALIFLGACQPNNEVFDQKPSERVRQSLKVFQEELTNAPYGWEVVYFPRVDSLKLTDPKRNILSRDFQEGNLGYGGFAYAMRFDREGSVRILSDRSETEAREESIGSYRLEHTAATQLSFTSYTYLHSLVGDLFRGSADFLFLGKDYLGNLRLSSPLAHTPAQEYWSMKPFSSEDEFVSYASSSRSNRMHFESMDNPQIRIHRGDRDFFRSDVPSKVKVSTNQKYLEEIVRKRYIVFRQVVVPADVRGEAPKEAIGLGSGYVGTGRGLAFQPGWRLNDNLWFTDFQRIGDRYVCELVEVYDHMLGKVHYVPAHLASKGSRSTHVVAEIWDDVQK